MVLPAHHAAFSDGDLKKHLGELRKGLKSVATELAFAKEPEACRRLGIHPRTADRLRTALRDLQENMDTFKAIGEKVASPGHVTAAVLYRRHWVLSVRAVEVADLLRDHLYEGRDCVIFTSATLRQGESFDGFRRAAGDAGRMKQARGGSANSVSQPSPRPSIPRPGRSPFPSRP